MAKTRPEQFEKFNKLLMESAPVGYIPHYFPVEADGKAPDGRAIAARAPAKSPCHNGKWVLKGNKWCCPGCNDTKGSWKQKYARLTPEEVVARLKSGGNYGVAGRPDDCLQIGDIDSMRQHVAAPDTLAVRTRSSGQHLFWFAKSPEAKLNLPTENDGELRGIDQYVVGAGSYCSISKGDMKKKVQAGTFSQEEAALALGDARCGSYSVEVELPSKQGWTIVDAPEFFRVQYADMLEKEQPTTESSAFVPGQMHPLFGLNYKQILPGGHTDRMPHPLHDSETGANFCIGKEFLAHCWRHNVSLTPVQFLAVKAGFCGCLEAGKGHKNSNAGPSIVNGNKEAILAAFRQAVSDGFLPKDCPAPWSEQGESQVFIPADILALLKNPELYDKIMAELGKKIVGETDTVTVILICGCGIYVVNHNATSYNLMQSAEAGAGKDYTLNATLSIFPERCYLKRSRISAKVLTYWHRSDKEPGFTWDGKILYLEDATQELLDSEVVKVFLSSGSYATILINQVATDLKINGKPVVMFSSATTRLNKEQGRRVPMLRCDESLGQTKKIMEKQAHAAEHGEVQEYDSRITDALAFLRRIKVTVPFAHEIQQRISPNNIILRTHFPRLLDYIKASCALHQFQRKKEGEFFVAEARDYELAKLAFKKITSNPYSIPLSHQEQKMLEKIDELQATASMKTGFDGFTFDEIEQHVQFWKDTQLRDELRKLADANLLIVGKRAPEGGKGGRAALTYRRPSLTTVELPEWDASWNTAPNPNTETTADTKTTELTETTAETNKEQGVNSVYSVKIHDKGEVPGHG